MTNGEIDNLNQRFAAIVNDAKEAHRLFRSGCNMTSVLQLSHLMAKIREISAIIEDDLNEEDDADEE